MLFRSIRKGLSKSLTISEKKLGSKAVQIQSNPDSDFTSQVSGACSDKFSIPDDLALQLGEIGVQIEEELGNWRPVDIEWAIDEVN